MLAGFLAQLEKTAQAVSQAEIALRTVTATTDSTDVMQLASLLFQLEEFESAVPLYERLVASPGRDRLTRHLLICLIETDRRQQAQTILDQMPAQARQSSVIRRIECNFAQQTSNWSRVRELLSSEVERESVRADFAVAYACALYKLGDLDALRAFLKDDPKFKGARPNEEFEFAKYQTGFGLHAEAIHRLYRLFLQNPSNSEIAGYFLSQLLLAPPLSELGSPAVAGPSSAVRLRGGGDTWWVAIGDIDFRGGGWPEFVRVDSVIARQLDGSSVGQKVDVSRGAIQLDAEIVELKSIFAFAADKANELIAASVSPAGPLWSFPVLVDGEPNMEVLLGVAAKRRMHAERALDVYRERRFPLCLLAGLLGTDVVSLVLDWPSTESLFVGVGTHEEKQSSMELAEKAARRFVIDLVALTELTKRGAFRAVVEVLGRPIVPQSLRDEIVDTIQVFDRQRPALVMTEESGRISITKIPAEYYEERKKLLEEVLGNIDRECDICLTLGPVQCSDELRKTVQLLDRSTGDVLFLCAEKNAALLSEDGGLRQLALSAGIVAAIGIQPILMVAKARGLISGEAYARIVADKILANHDFVSVGAEDMLLLASLSQNLVSKEMRAILESFKRGTIEIQSAVRVALEFLIGVVQRFPLKVAAEYSRIVRDVLIEGRPEIREAIVRLLSKVLQRRFGRNGRKVGLSERRLFDGLLDRRLLSPAEKREA